MKKRILKLLSFGVAFTMLFALSGCKERYYDYYQIKEEIINVEIGELADNGTEDKPVIIKTLSSAEKDELLLGLSRLGFKNRVGTELPNLGRYCVRLYYADGNYQVIYHASSFNYDSTGKRITTRRWYCTKEEFDNLISMFIDTAQSIC